MIATLLSLSLAVASHAAPADTAHRYTVVVRSDVTYGHAPIRNGRAQADLKLDVYTPTAGAPRTTLAPLFIAVHGGAFIKGDKESSDPHMSNMPAWCRDLTARGWVCLSIDYRLAQQRPVAEGSSLRERAVRASIDDAAMAMRWAFAHAAELGIDTTRVAIGGTSAGALISLFTAYPNPAHAPRVKAVIDLWGGLGKDTSAITRGAPPVLIVHGTKDPTAPFSGAEAIASAAKAAGVPHEFYPVDGAGHGVPLGMKWQGVSFYDRIASFLDRYVVR